MKAGFLIILLLAAYAVRGQGALIVDQQSTNHLEGALILQNGEPFGQSFTPNLSSIDFVTLNLFDGDLEDLGATIHVNLRADSITGTILGITDPVNLPNASLGNVTFMFSTPVNLTPSVMYYMEIVAEPGSDYWESFLSTSSYTRGAEIYQGVAYPGDNLWFQEGIITTPEPSSVALVAVGGLTGLWLRRRGLK